MTIDQRLYKIWLISVVAFKHQVYQCRNDVYDYRYPQCVEQEVMHTSQYIAQLFARPKRLPTQCFFSLRLGLSSQPARLSTSTALPTFAVAAKRQAG